MRNSSPAKSLAILVAVVGATVFAITIAVAIGATQEGRDLLRMIGTVAPALILIGAIAYASQFGMRA